MLSVSVNDIGRTVSSMDRRRRAHRGHEPGTVGDVPQWLTRRWTLSVPRSGSGTSGASGARSRATEEVVSSGSVSTQARQRWSTAAACSPA